MSKFKFENNNLVTIKKFNAGFARLLKQINRNEIEEIDLSNLKIILKEQKAGKTLTKQRGLNELECEQLSLALKENTSVQKLLLVNCGLSVKSIEKIANIFEAFGANDLGNQTLFEVDLGLVQELGKNRASTNLKVSRHIQHQPNLESKQELLTYLRDIQQATAKNRVPIEVEKLRIKREQIEMVKDEALRIKIDKKNEKKR